MLSGFNLNKMALGDRKRKEIVYKKFLKARDLSQRAVDETNKTDTDLYSSIVKTMTVLNATINNVTENFKNTTTFAEMVGTPDIWTGWMKTHISEFWQHTDFWNIHRKWTKIVAEGDIDDFKDNLVKFLGISKYKPVKDFSYLKWLEVCAGELTGKVAIDDRDEKGWSDEDYETYMYGDDVDQDKHEFKAVGMDDEGKIKCHPDHMKLTMFFLTKAQKNSLQAIEQLRKFSDEFPKLFADLQENTTKTPNTKYYNACLIDGAAQRQKAISILTNISATMKAYQDANQSDVYALLHNLRKVLEVFVYYQVKKDTFLTTSHIFSNCEHYNAIFNWNYARIRHGPNSESTFLYGMQALLNKFYVYDSDKLWSEFHQHMIKIRNIFSKVLWKLGSLSEKYLEGTTNKRDMHIVFGSLDMRKKIDNVLDLQDLVIESLHNIIDILSDIADTYGRLSETVNKADVPLIKHSAMMKISFLRNILDIKGISHHAFYEMMENQSISVAFHMMRQAFLTYKEPLASTLDVLSKDFSLLTYYIQASLSSLADFVATCKIDEDFYMYVSYIIYNKNNIK
jgi:hypothetical protein